MPECGDRNCTNDEEIIGDDCIRCDGCNSVYHYSCAGVARKTQQRKTQEKRNEWRCPQRCRAAREVTGDNRDTESVVSDDLDFDLDSITKTISNPELKLVFTCLMKKITTLHDSVKFMSNSFDEVLSRVKGNDSKIASLEKRLVIKDKKIEDLEYKLNSIEQYGRRNNIEIFGLEENQDENVYELVTKTVEKIVPEFVIGDIDIAHRLPTRNKKQNNSIIVVLKSRNLKEKIVSSARKGPKIKQSQIISSCSKNDQLVFVSENLSAYFKNLKWLTKQQAVKNGYKYVWYRMERF
ncbi:uncharacterized protein LOC120353855 [Nilaparvata lugens]|uniref:uncharacterized protein LOC120353855 n=1 Tax=Nilaparvata lugens TaxID=108931 RepID=UPI00193CD2C2|nr:uncharacterized protein LOC120353855 [Nilaparvata lugens]